MFYSFLPPRNFSRLVISLKTELLFKLVFFIDGHEFLM